VQGDSLQYVDEETWDPTEPAISTFSEGHGATPQQEQRQQQGHGATPQQQQRQQQQRQQQQRQQQQRQQQQQQQQFQGGQRGAHSEAGSSGMTQQHKYHLDAYTAPPSRRAHSGDDENHAKGSSCCSWWSNRPKWLYVALFFLVTVCFGAGVGVAVALLVTGDDKNTDSAAVGDDNFIAGEVSCESVVDAASLDPFRQCECFERIGMKEYVQEAYDALRTSSLIADNLENSNLSSDSCEAENIALVSVATNVESRKNRGLATSSKEILTYFSLSVLYTTLEGPGWTNHERWLSDLTPCIWGGVTCEDGTIVSLAMSNNYVRGTLDSRIGLLFDLKRLDLSYNGIEGSIPLDLWKLPNLGKYAYLPTLRCC
jgi:hypothetical protein